MLESDSRPRSADGSTYQPAICVISSSLSLIASKASLTVVFKESGKVLRTANGVLGWRPNARWEVATRLRGATGLPFTPFVEMGALAGTLDFARYNAERIPSFFAADVRVDRRFVMGRTQVIAFLDLQNVTNRLNPQAPQWNPRTRTVSPNSGIGLLPSISA